MAPQLKQFLPAAVAVVMLGLVAGVSRLEIRKDGVAEYMARARVAVEALPTKVGPWEAQRQALDPHAADLLKPNAERMYLYTHGGRDRVQALYSVIQVDDASFMTGHAPMNCYPGNNYEMVVPPAPRVWRVGDLPPINGTEYVFRRQNAGGAPPTVLNVRNFFVFPDGEFGSSLARIDAAAADYRKVKYGATQVQLITNGDDPKHGIKSGLTDDRREQVFQDLVGSEKSVEMIRILRTGIPK